MKRLPTPLIRMMQPGDMRALCGDFVLTTSLGLRPQSRFTSQSVVLDRTLMVFFPSQHKVVLPAFN